MIITATLIQPQIIINTTIKLVITMILNTTTIPITIMILLTPMILNGIMIAIISLATTPQQSIPPMTSMVTIPELLIVEKDAVASILSPSPTLKSMTTITYSCSTVPILALAVPLPNTTTL